MSKNIRYTGIQPQYFPRLHYFARILNTDIFVLRDDAQFVRKHRYPDGKNGKSYQAHTPIKQSFGSHLLNVPTQHAGFIPISSTKISYESNWQDEHLKTIKISYSKAPFFEKIFPEIEKILNRKYDTISDLNIATIFWAFSYLLGEEFNPENISLKSINEKLSKNKLFRLKEIKKASKSIVLRNKNLSTNEKIVVLIKEVGANEDYCGGTGAAAYMDDDLFSKNGISVIVQDWKCQEYPQLFTKQQGFIADLSIIDLLFNVSIDDARKILSG